MIDAKILLVDDEEAILQMLTAILRKEGFTRLDTATTGEDALALCAQTRYDLILLDVMLPGCSGYDLCPQIRQTTDAPLFFLTARTSDLDKLFGFAAGADDYITKPFNPLEVAARVKAHLRRRSAASSIVKVPDVYDFGTLVVDTRSGEVRVREQLVELPAQVYQLLVFFCRHPKQLFSKAQLYEQVWGDAYLGEDNTVMVHIHKLRERIEIDPSDPKMIVTVRGLGYKFVPPDAVIG